MGEMFCDIPHEVISIRQNQCPTWENFKFSAAAKELIPNHGKGFRSMSWLVPIMGWTSVYNGLTPTTQGHIDVVIGGAFFSLKLSLH